MSSAPIAILEHKKQPFLKALVQCRGKVVPASRRARVSPDAVYDWLKADASFRRQFQKAKREYYDSETSTLSEALDIFLAVVKPILPSEYLTRVIAATNLKLSQRKFKDVSSSTVRSTSRNKVRFPSVDVHPESANSVDSGNRFENGKNGQFKIS